MKTRKMKSEQEKVLFISQNRINMKRQKYKTNGKTSWTMNILLTISYSLKTT